MISALDRKQRHSPLSLHFKTITAISAVSTFFCAALPGTDSLLSAAFSISARFCTGVRV